MGYREYESRESLLKEHAAADRIRQHWRGSVLPAQQYEPYDRILTEPDGTTAALVEIKVRNYDIQYLIEQRYMISYSKVRSLIHAAKRRQCVPLIMVVCSDDDFLLDLRDETGQTIRSVNRINDRHFDDRSGETLWQAEHMVLFSGSRFIPLFALGGLL